jgi:hypothetical protein
VTNLGHERQRDRPARARDCYNAALDICSTAGPTRRGRAASLWRPGCVLGAGRGQRRQKARASRSLYTAMAGPIDRGSSLIISTVSCRASVLIQV